jgi:hypothetical protein
VLVRPGFLPLPEPEPEPQAIPGLSQEWQSPAEREFALQLCKDAGKELDKLSDPDKLLLWGFIAELQESVAEPRSTCRTGSDRKHWLGRKS